MDSDPHTLKDFDAGLAELRNQLLSMADFAIRSLEQAMRGLMDGNRDRCNEVIAEDDVWLLESWAEVQRLGFGKELGFGIDDVVLYDEIVTQLFMREAQLIASRLPDVPPERAAEMVEKALPVVHRFLTGLHRTKIRNFLASIG